VYPHSLASRETPGRGNPGELKQRNPSFQTQSLYPIKSYIAIHKPIHYRFERIVNFSYFQICEMASDPDPRASDKMHKMVLTDQYSAFLVRPERITCPPTCPDLDSRTLVSRHCGKEQNQWKICFLENEFGEVSIFDSLGTCYC
jgi:hypothetical protein